MRYEIVNPSDNYGIDGERLPCLAAVLLLGGGQYALRDPVTGESEGLTLFLTREQIEAALIEWFGQPGEDYMTDHAAEIAAALETVRIAPDDYEAAVACLPDGADRAAFDTAWHNRHRTSLNDIGARALACAKRLRERA